MRYILQNTASEDTVQLFDSSDAVVAGVAAVDITVEIRKEGSATWDPKSMSGANWTASALSGNYIITFAGSDFDTLGLLRYRITSNLGAFKRYEDSLFVVDEMPTLATDPPTINAQTATPAGMSPNPVFRGTSPNTLTISGAEMAGVTAVTVGGTSVAITANDNTSVAVTIPSSIPLGENAVVVTTPGGTATGLVTVVVHPDDIPGQLANITGRVFNPATGTAESGISVMGFLLDMPVIVDGVAWTNNVVKTTTNTNGEFSLALPRDKRVEVFIPKADYRREFIVPNVASADLFTEIP